MNEKIIRVYCDGIFDLFHFGHAKMLEQAKKSFPNVHLMVGVCNDQLTHQYKGKTVMNQDERIESIRHCKWVDEIIPNAPWIITPEFMNQHQIDYVAHDDLPYESASSNDVYKHLKESGHFLCTNRTPCISTSLLIQRILDNCDEYIQRNESRKLE